MTKHIPPGDDSYGKVRLVYYGHGTASLIEPINLNDLDVPILGTATEINLQALTDNLSNDERHAPYPKYMNTRAHRLFGYDSETFYNIHFGEMKIDDAEE